MTITVRTAETNDGKHRASVEWQKHGGYRLTVYRASADHIVQSCDIVKDTVYPTEKAAIAAMHRKLRELNRN